jgi:CubicO group peptidase (beta-lactamase class C family)
VTGFLIARGDTILVERYQYGRTDTQRLTSFSMAKTIVGLLIGAALADGAINSLNDFAETYAPGLRGSEYGRTPIRALLQMASGVTFREDYADPTSDIYRLADLALGQDPGGSLAALRHFNRRHAPPGESFSYSSADTVVLGLVLAGATGRTVAEYASEKLWGPMGAEADASWITDGSGQEITYAYVNAVLRDWARLGLVLAHDGVWQERSVVSGDWLLESSTIQPGSPFRSMAPGSFIAAYGTQIWLAPEGRRLFSMRGLRGQFVLVDPDNRLVLVQTALDHRRRGDPRALPALALAARAAELRAAPAAARPAPAFTVPACSPSRRPRTSSSPPRPGAPVTATRSSCWP